MKNISHWITGMACALFLSASTTGAIAANCGMNSGSPATGEPIPVGAIVTASGPADFSPGARGAEAYFDCVNANGGINGRPVEFSFDDDQARPDRALELAKRMLEDRNAVAMIGSASVVECITTAQYYQEAGVISLMSTAVAPHCFAATNIAMMNAGPRYGGISIVKFGAEKLGIGSIACPQPTTPGSDWICDGIEKFANQNGLEFSRFPVDLATVDNDSLVQQILQTGAEGVIINGTVPTFVPLMAAVERVDAASQVKFLFPMTLYDPSVPATVGAYWNDKAWANLEYRPPNMGGADASNYLEIMDAAGIPPNALAQGGYLAARLFTEALMKLDPDAIDRASVTAALQEVQDFDSDMLCETWAFGPKDAPGRLGNRSSLTAQIHEGAWQVNDSCLALTDDEIGN